MYKNKQEVIVMGRGIAFNKRVGEDIDEDNHYGRPGYYKEV
ncbi:CAT RNA binding domain-containing protein [Halobacillus sp. SY10]